MQLLLMYYSLVVFRPWSKLCHNVNIRDFVIVKYEGTFYPGEVLHFVSNQSATVSKMECSGLKF